jgi:multidrug transporter EmrE-like cation transporter
VWVGVGAVGAFCVAVTAGGQRTNPAQLAAMAALVASIAAVKVTSS